MAQWLRLLAACPEDWGSGVSQSSNTQRKENEWSFVYKNEQGLGQLYTSGKASSALQDKEPRLMFHSRPLNRQALHSALPNPLHSDRGGKGAKGKLRLMQGAHVRDS